MTELHVTLPPDDANGAVLRERIRDWCRAEAVRSEACDDAELVASELFSNAVRATVRAGNGDRPGATGDPIDVRIRRIADQLADPFDGRAGPDGRVDRVEISARNVGEAFDPRDFPPPSATRPGGRGLMIARALGVLSVAHSGRHTTVRVALHDLDAATRSK